jgi:hypothetical protein
MEDQYIDQIAWSSGSIDDTVLRMQCMKASPQRLEVSPWVHYIDAYVHCISRALEIGQLRTPLLHCTSCALLRFQAKCSFCLSRSCIF